MDGFKKQGRNTFAFWLLICLLFAICLANLALTMTIISVLRVGRGLELVPEENYVKFSRVDLDRIQKRDGILEGFSDVPMSIEGDAGPVQMTLVYNRVGHVHNKLTIGLNETHFRNVNHFEIRHPVTREVLFNTARPVFNIVAESAATLRANSVAASRIASPVGENLQLQTRGKLVVSGAEGIGFSGKEQIWSADQNIFLKTVNGTIGLSSKALYLTRAPIAAQLEHGIRSGELQFKLCICMPQGRLFRVALPRGIQGSKVTCSHISSEFDPCE